MLHVYQQFLPHLLFSKFWYLRTNACVYRVNCLNILVFYKLRKMFQDPQTGIEHATMLSVVRRFKY